MTNRSAPWLGARWLAGLLMCALPLASLAQWGNRAAPVVVAEAQQQLMAPMAWLPGTVVSRDEASLAAEVAGRLTWVAEIGTRVAAGEAVARLDDALIKAEIEEAQADIARAEAQSRYLSADVERLRTLARQDSVAKSQLDKIEADRQMARSELAASQARLKLAKERYARHVIKAPFAGVVTERLKRKGEWAGSGADVVRLADHEALEVQVRIPEGSLIHVNQGDSLPLKRSAAGGQGTVSAVVPVGDARSHLFELRLAVKGGQWRAGQAVRVGVPTDAPREVLAVPRDALVLRRSGASVYRVKADDTAEQVEVSTGMASGGLIEVKGGLQAGDKVVIRGGERLRPGQSVAIQGGAQS